MYYKVYEAVNANLLGLNKDERRSGNYQLHPLIRDDWKSVDKYRDLQGNVPALTTNANGDLIVDERVADGGDSSFFRPFVGPTYTQTGGYNLFDTITITFKAENYLSDWNDGNINNVPEMENLLEQNNPNGPFAGIPYFEKFFNVNVPPTEGNAPYGLLTTDARMAGATRNIRPIMQQDWTSGLKPANRIFNHKFNYRYYDRTLEQSEYNIEIESVYNLFLDTDPDYELAISDVSEVLIPNFYHIETSISTAENDGSVIPAYNVFDNTQINNEDYINVLLGSLSSSNIAENDSTSQGFLQFYCNNITNVSQDYKTNFGNVAVLSHDVADGILNVINGTIRDDRGTSTEQDDFYAIETYPFYNKITIPYINQWAGNPIIEALINNSVLGLEWTQYFITLLELLIIKEYKLTEDGSSTPATSLPFVIYDTNDGNKVVSQSQNVDLAIRVEDVLNALIDQDTSNSLYQDIEFIFSDGIDYLTGDGLPQSGASFIQNYGDPNAADSFFNSFSEWYDDLTVNQLNAAKNIFGLFRNGGAGTNFVNINQNFENIYRSTEDNSSNHQDTPIMYMVEKRVIPVGQLSVDANDPSTVVQRFFFGRDITGGEKGITYYDTQIKYGVRYQYDIKQIRLVVGEQYYYHDYVSITNSGSIHQGRAIGNALGFYAEENVDITSTQTFQIANNLEDVNGFTYLPEDEETPFVAWDATQVGYYVYKIPLSITGRLDGTAAIGNINDIFAGGSYPQFSPSVSSTWSTSYPPAAFDLNLVLINIKGGDGLDGNLDGGAIGVAASGSSVPTVDATLVDTTGGGGPAPQLTLGGSFSQTGGQGQQADPGSPGQNGSVEGDEEPIEQSAAGGSGASGGTSTGGTQPAAPSSPPSKTATSNDPFEVAAASATTSQTYQNSSSKTTSSKTTSSRATAKNIVQTIKSVGGRG